MDEIIRVVMRHDRVLTKWAAQLTKDFAKQKKINKKLGGAIIALCAGLIYEDYNLYKTDQKVKDLEQKIENMESENKDDEE